MNSQEFISKALKTEYVPEVLLTTEAELTTALKMAIACSNIMDQIKKYIIYGKDIDIVKLSDNQSDLHWYSEDFVEYIQERENTVEMAVPLTNNNINIRLLHAAIGIFTESGEMLEALLKQLQTGELDKVNYGEENGDIDWYQAIALDEIGIPEEQIRKTLIAKLAKRYPEKFTQEAALNRDLTEERKVLEEGMQSC
jgi:hypothetical protein